MHTYLLDTCIWSYWFDSKKAQHTRVVDSIQNLASGSKLGISIITWGEIAHGHKVVSPELLPIQSEYLQFIQSKGPKTFEIDIHTASTYGELRALLFEKLPKETKRKKRAEQVVDPVTGLELGIDENDLWIVAQAITRNLILVTNDKLARIRKVAGEELSIKNWAEGCEASGGR
ncbi:MAG: type II toxin-antitoxin system VapC family toxin [Planctomycetota bacterium]|jgi:predicted nucleic acid-binding protein